MLLALVAGAMGCSRGDPAVRPRVTPERAPIDTPTVASPVAATAAPPEPPPAPDGPAALSIRGGVEVVGLHGRIDHLQIAASGERARILAELGGAGAIGAATVAVEVTMAGEISTPQIQSVGAVGARVVAAVAAAPDGFRTFLFGDRGADADAADSDNAHRFVIDGAAPALPTRGTLFGAAGARVRSEPQLFEAEGLVASGDGDRVVAAAVGAKVECLTEICPVGARLNAGFLLDPRTGYEMRLVEIRGGLLGVRRVLQIDCVDGAVGIHADSPRPEGWRPPPIPNRCRGREGVPPSDVAVAVRGAEVAVAFRTPRAVLMPRWTASAVVPAPTTVAEGEVGAPAMAWRGDEVVMVWAQRASPASPYALHAVQWNPSTSPRPPAPTALATGAASAFAPALLARGAQLVLAWMEGDDRAAVVRVGSTRQSIGHAVDHAIAVSAAGRNARDPELAGSSDRAWIAWSEYPGGRCREQSSGVVRASPLRLP
jgi:hypothetical protein